MDEDNWLTVGKPKKVKSGEIKTVNEANGEQLNRHNILHVFMANEKISFRRRRKLEADGFDKNKVQWNGEEG